MTEEQNVPEEETITEEAEAKANRFVGEIKEQTDKLLSGLKEWGIDLDKFASRATEAGNEAQDQFKKAITDLQTRVDDQRIQATAETKVIGDQVEIAWSKMKEGFEAIVARQKQEAEAMKSKKSGDAAAVDAEAETASDESPGESTTEE